MPPKIKRSKPSKRDPNRPKNKEKYKSKALMRERDPEKVKELKERQDQKKKLRLARRAAKNQSAQSMTKASKDAEEQVAGAGLNQVDGKPGKRKLEEDFISLDVGEPKTKKMKTKEKQERKRDKKAKKKADSKQQQSTGNAGADNDIAQTSGLAGTLQQADESRSEAAANPVLGMKDIIGTSTAKDKSKRKDKAKDGNDTRGASNHTKGEEEDESQPKQALEIVPDATEDQEESNGLGTNPDPKQQQHRFILFVGNLPFSTTDAQLGEHFAPFFPTAIRHRTHPNDDPSKKVKAGRSKGFAFLEFASWSTMKLCMAKMHHSEIKDDKGNPRKINVELTAGGGGKGEQRKSKLKEKNARLEDERKRKAKARDEEKKIKSEGKEAQEKEKAIVENNNMDVHPSRQARIKHS